MNTTTLLTPFAEDILAGLSAKQKHISSKYFYDDNGSRIFMQIMKMPEYYPTACEFEILSRQSAHILTELPFTGEFNIVELGCGDGIKTIQLLTAFTAKDASFTYIPVDISAEAITTVTANVANALPGIAMKPQVADYFTVMDKLSDEGKPCLYLFLGGNIGNYPAADAEALLRRLNAGMQEGDMLLMGIDLQKNPRIIQKAYDDPHGITRAFNLNLLHRINGELDADIKPDQFEFYCDYNPATGEVNSYLVSLKQQHVHSVALNHTFTFEKDELVWTELSKKYTLDGIDTLAAATGFTVKHNFKDCRHYFTDSLWIK